MRNKDYCIIYHSVTGKYQLIGVGHCKNNQDALYFTGDTVEDCIKAFKNRDFQTWCNLYLEIKVIDENDSN